MSISHYKLLHQHTLGDPSVRIAVLDGPVDLSHPCFQGANITLINTLATSSSASGIAAQHGTHVASIIFGQPGSSVPGIAPGCQGLIAPVFQGTETGGIQPCSQLDLARAIAQAITHGANVINISAGQLGNSGQPEPLLESILKQCEDQNILVVAAAGNNGCDCVHVPAAYRSVLVVGGMDERGEPLDFSNWGESYRSHGVLAQGKNVLGAIPGAGTQLSTGSSFAAPLIAGMAGILLSWEKCHGGGMNAKLVRAAILETAIDCEQQPTQECQRLLAGRINVQGAFEYLQQRKQNNMSEQTENPVKPVETTKASPPTTNIEETLIQASGCGCGGKTTNSSNDASINSVSSNQVFAIGQIDVDFENEANRVYFNKLSNGGETDRAKLGAFLDLTPNLSYSERVTWILKQNGIPIYALYPVGAFAIEGYKEIVKFYCEQVACKDGDIHVALPGVIVGNKKKKLQSGQEVPLVAMDHRAFSNWSIPALAKGLIADPTASPAIRALPQATLEEVLKTFVDRVYYEFQNLGVTAQDRALNYAATNVMQASTILALEFADPRIKLDTIEVSKSRLNISTGDAWDIKLTFFEPANRLTAARKVHLFTVDVSNVMPVMIGTRRSWEIY